MTIERQWTVQSYMKRPSGELEGREQSLVKESMDVITTNEILCKQAPADNIEEGVPPGEPDQSNSQGDANTNEPWLDRQINSLTAVLLCGPLISPQTIGDESQEPPQSTEVDTTVEPRHPGIPPPSSTSTENENGPINNDVSILHWSQKKKSLTNADNSFEPTALQSSSSEDKESQYSTNNSKPTTRSANKNNIFRWRLCWIIVGLLLILGALLALFLPNWDGRFRIKKSSSMATTNGISSPTLAPTTAKPSMAPSYGPAAIVLTFLFDDFPEEIAWQLMDSNAGMVVDDFPFLGYEPGIRTISHRIPVTMNKEYVLTVSDEGLDGLCCKTPGEYFVTFRGQQLVSGGGNFGAKISHTFIIPEIM